MPTQPIHWVFLLAGVSCFPTIALSQSVEDLEAPPTLGNQPRKPGDERVRGIFKDPYDSKFDASGNYSVTDNAKYDAELPNHPLTRLPKTFPDLMKALVMPNDDAEGDKPTDSLR